MPAIIIILAVIGITFMACNFEPVCTKYIDYTQNIYFKDGEVWHRPKRDCIEKHWDMEKE